MWGISPITRPTRPWARRGEQHIAGGGWESPQHQRRDIMLRSAEQQWRYWSPVARYSNRQHISTFFPPLTQSVTMLHYSTGCSVISSCAREPFALQAGPWRRCASTAWRWGLLFICRPGANCYSIALTTQRYILCLGALSRVKALTQNIEGTNLFPLCED